jgi:hypothetical protein
MPYLSYALTFAQLVAMCPHRLSMGGAHVNQRSLCLRLLVTNVVLVATGNGVYMPAHSSSVGSGHWCRLMVLAANVATISLRALASSDASVVHRRSKCDVVMGAHRWSVATSIADRTRTVHDNR